MFNYRQSIANRLSLLLYLVFGLYLAGISATGYVMYNQYQGFSTLASSQFDRALAAAELTRDAEIIAAEVFESLVSGNHSTQPAAATQRITNLTELYKTARQKLRSKSPDTPADERAQQDIDHWQKPFFDSLTMLNQRLNTEHAQQATDQQRIDQLFLLLRQIQNVPEDAVPGFSFYSLALLSYANMALNAQRPGQLAQLSERSQTIRQKLNDLVLTDKTQLQVRTALNEQIQAIFKQRRVHLNSSRATLATARQTRLLAQKLTSATYNYHLQLKAEAKAAIQKHQQLIHRSLLGLAISAMFLVAITIIAAIYIRRSLVTRLKTLSASMRAHMIGGHTEIPQQGHDEISEMGQAFAVFVNARKRAEEQLADANAHLQEMNAELHALSEIDALTQIANRRSFYRCLNQEWRRALRAGDSLAILMADVDLFKRFNDSYGHPAGDDCLYRVAQAMAMTLKREGDLVARYGGEEFIVLLPATNLEQAAQLGEQLLESIRVLNIEHRESTHGQVSISLGVAACKPSPRLQAEALIRQADEALYQAKNNGRNRLQTANTSLV